MQVHVFNTQATWLKSPCGVRTFLSIWYLAIVMQKIKVSEDAGEVQLSSLSAFESDWEEAIRKLLV